MNHREPSPDVTVDHKDMIRGVKIFLLAMLGTAALYAAGDSIVDALQPDQDSGTLPMPAHVHEINDQ